MLVKKQHTNRMLAAPRITGPPGSPVVGSRFRKPSIEIGRYGGHLFFCKDILDMQEACLLKKVRRLGAIIIELKRSTQIQRTSVRFLKSIAPAS